MKRGAKTVRVVLTPEEHIHAITSVMSSWRGVRYSLRPEIRDWMKANLKQTFRYDRVDNRYGHVIIHFELPEDAVIFKLFIS